MRTKTEEEIEEIHKDYETKEFHHKVLFLGEEKEDVISSINNTNLEWRIVQEDDNQYITTGDYNPERLNFTFKNNILTEINYG